MTDNEIIKALERCGYHKECCYCNSVEECGSKRVLVANALSLINRQKAEIEMLNSRKEVAVPSMKFIDGNPLNGFNLKSNCFVARTIGDVKAEAYKEFYEKLHTEVLAARDSNFEAKEERIAKSKEYGILIDVEDSFLMYCDGKIHALKGIDYFAYETYKEMVGENDA